MQDLSCHFISSQLPAFFSVIWFEHALEERSVEQSKMQSH